MDVDETTLYDAATSAAAAAADVAAAAAAAAKLFRIRLPCSRIDAKRTDGRRRRGGAGGTGRRPTTGGDVSPVGGDAKF